MFRSSGTGLVRGTGKLGINYKASMCSIGEGTVSLAQY